MELYPIYIFMDILAEIRFQVNTFFLSILVSLLAIGAAAGGGELTAQASRAILQEGRLQSAAGAGWLTPSRILSGYVR